MSVCMFLIQPNQYEFFIFGQPIFQNYYIVHSMENATMGFVPSAQSTKDFVKKGQLPTQTFVPVSDAGGAGGGSSITMNRGTIVAFLYVVAVFYVYTQFVSKPATTQVEVSMQQITTILFFASAAIVYELVLTKLFPDVPALGQIIGVISRSTGTLIRHFTGPALLAAAVYKIRSKWSEPTKNQEVSFDSNK